MVDYAYSGDDLRVSRTEGGVTETYLWDRLSALPTMVDDGTTQSVHGPAGVANEITGSTSSYALPDGLGSVRAWADSSGLATGATDWDAWGMVRSSTGSVGLHGFTGERADPTTNLVYLRARDYSPGSARFVQPDPLQPNADGTHGYNPYWYANNNPGTFTDPTGMSAGEVNGSLGITLSTSAAGALAIAFTGGVLVGAGAALLMVGGFNAFVFLVMAVLFFMLILYMESAINCMNHGCTLSEATIAGFLTSRSTQDGTDYSFTLSGTKPGACTAVLAFPGIAWSPSIVSECAPTYDCGAEFAVSVAEIVLENVYDIPISSLTGQSSSRCGIGSSGSSGNCSFSADTGVLLADGTVKPIADIRVGEWVLAEDPETGERGARQVTHLWVHQDQLVDLEIDGGVVTTTEDHPFWNATDGEWQQANTLNSGDSVLTSDGEQIAVSGLNQTTTTQKMAYNLTVAEIHAFFVVVGGVGVLVHNACKKAPDLDNLSDKIKKDMSDRGWTARDIQDMFDNPSHTYSVKDLATGDPATAYARSRNDYVVVNDVTGKVVHVSDRNDPGWKPVWEDPTFNR